MGARELLHEIVSHLPVHEKVKDSLHEKVDEVHPPEETPEENEGEQK